MYTDCPSCLLGKETSCSEFSIVGLLAVLTIALTTAFPPDRPELERKFSPYRYVDTGQSEAQTFD